MDIDKNVCKLCDEDFERKKNGRGFNKYKVSSKLRLAVGKSTGSVTVEDAIICLFDVQVGRMSGL